MLPSAVDFWEFSAEIYNCAGVKDACLEAQDLYGADVNLILLYLWCDREGIAVPEKAHEALETISVLWQREKLAPHRARRRDAKGKDGYETLLSDELVLERAEQAALLAIANEYPPREQAAQPNNCGNYLTDLNTPLSLLKPLHAAIGRA
ncbi:TIGR02444 family protein [Kordiimonas aestuarii]|uniref:TIGR02444 family protein n=1 Tax=Kordiimonas aestuarii TaxID=1005925 RepID=UPI0021D06C65|nr:TIGR02444 family protein [Kordiimonas aestuarii]